MAASFSMTKPPLCLSYKKRLNPAPSQRVSWLRPHGLECKSNGRVSGSQTCGNATPPLPSQFCSGIRRGRVPASAKWGCDVTERSHLGEPGGACLWICRACRVSAARYHVLTLWPARFADPLSPTTRRPCPFANDRIAVWRSTSEPLAGATRTGRTSSILRACRLGAASTSTSGNSRPWN